MIRRTVPSTTQTATAAPAAFRVARLLDPMPTLPDSVVMAGWVHPSTQAQRIYINGLAGRFTKVYVEAQPDGGVRIRCFDDLKTGGELARIAADAHELVRRMIGPDGTFADLGLFVSETNRLAALRRAGIIQ